MGIFDFFKKKQEVLPQPEPIAPVFDKNVFLMTKLHQRLEEMGYQLAWHSQYLALVLNDELEIAMAMIETPGTHPNVMQVKALLSHPQHFAGGIIDNLAGIGTSFDDRVNAALDNFITTIFETVIESLGDRHDPDLDLLTITNGRDVLWHPNLGAMITQGEWESYPENPDLFKLFRDELETVLTDNKINWLKIYISKMADGSIRGECAFNNKNWDAGFNIIHKYASAWTIPGEFKGLKQFIVLRRCDAYDL